MVAPHVVPGIFTADDDTLIQAFRDADLPSLLPALAFVTGDMSLVPDELRPQVRISGAAMAPQGGLAPEQQESARSLALDCVRKFRGAGAPADRIDDAALRRLMRFITGDTKSDYEPLLLKELGLAELERSDDLDNASGLSALVIGAGMSGLIAAHRLDQAGVDFTVVERNADVGGVWLENSYPGCRLDTNNFAYSYSYAQKSDWNHQYSTQRSIHEYFRDVADRLSLRDKIVFGTEVISAVYDEDDCVWTVTMRSSEGVATQRVNILISAVGQLNQPSIPDFPGTASFKGTAFHTARWDHSVDLAGKSVAVIGTGASAYQSIPSIADEVGELFIMQRSAPWALPAPAYHDEIAPGLKWLFQNLPHYHSWFRFYQFWIAVDGMRRFAVVDSDWQRSDSVSEANYQLKLALESHIRAQYTDRPDLIDKVIPDYPPYSKRMLRDNGVWARTLHQDHVSLVTDKIERLTEDGILMESGEEYKVDVIIYGTGFKASDFLAPMQIIGRDGKELHEQWGADPRAYLGITVPNFPNLFCLYGPNTNLVLNGSIIMFSELGMKHIMDCINTLASQGPGSLECAVEPYEAYNRRVDEGNEMMAWGIQGVRNWYKSSSGRVSQNWPFSTIEYWRVTHHFNAEDYTYTPAAVTAGTAHSAGAARS
ncbi:MULTISPECIES: NAD(P)/FAD-dependent oxidoreductase [unclassified Rhodococcus (in: high G+C Gram-positive bacteria)]|uniref:flavin-containing monooxygenase n=1 Tax=unclassified Rhodococcus (in: high G+C Gram-positive bacteria) TaxID=192944 RepID=UPI00163996AE|nr:MULTISPECIES: NAD(P)/FAD-dependent oxidoreductase [unclassified Rhodococcus (in: high G+C Gram-positive bacteria)]MBC2637756.1 NAD(P)/FAD-dependent oxidoreductase [Rhodococcus sp. 3A]MBC2897499.1 NAD(P)/FAD-dependent oxidoreductase [Rhodococcus sp. 4CII]